MIGLSASVLFQEFQERIVYVFGALLLSPMTATFQDYCLAKQGHELFQARDEMVPIRRSVNPVSIANDIECRDLNLIETGNDSWRWVCAVAREFVFVFYLHRERCGLFVRLSQLLRKRTPFPNNLAPGIHLVHLSAFTFSP